MDARKTKTSSPFLSSRSKPKRSVYPLVFLKFLLDILMYFSIFLRIFVNKGLSFFLSGAED